MPIDERVQTGNRRGLTTFTGGKVTDSLWVFVSVVA